MTYKFGMIGLGAILALAAPTAVRAQGSGSPNGTGTQLVISLTLTASVQADDGDKDNQKTDTITSKTVTKKLSTVDIIKAVENDNGATATKNAKLVYDNGDVNVIDGDNTYDASSFVTINLDPNDHGVWTGTDSTDDNSGDETEKYSGSYLFTFHYEDDSGLVVDVGGLVKETYTIGKTNKNGDQPTTDSLSVNFVGDGTSSSGANGTVKGTLKASGKGIF